MTYKTLNDDFIDVESEEIIDDTPIDEFKLEDKPPIDSELLNSDFNFNYPDGEYYPQPKISTKKKPLSKEKKKSKKRISNKSKKRNRK